MQRDTYSDTRSMTTDYTVRSNPKGSNLNFASKKHENPKNFSSNEATFKRNNVPNEVNFMDHIRDRNPNPYYLGHEDNNFLSDIRESSYDSEFLQMEAETVGVRQVQDSADQAMSREELARLHKTKAQPSRAETKQGPLQDKSSPIREKEVPVPVNKKEAVREGISRDVTAARDKLAEFPLETIPLTQKGIFDMRYNVSKEYLAQCSAAEVDPLDYYYENIEKKKGGGEVSRKEERVVSKAPDVREPQGRKVEKKVSREEEIRMKMLEAQRKLDEAVEAYGLKKTKTGNLDRRYKANQDFLELEAQTKESYYQ